MQTKHIQGILIYKIQNHVENKIRFILYQQRQISNTLTCPKFFLNTSQTGYQDFQICAQICQTVHIHPCCTDEVEVRCI